ncbi:uncharacterized protein FOKN1_0735 [Thiohalobacter thiocyanaticus]|uniref:EF-hand domain-containing protein n=2 Tax=Thiohalobacter TaxID=1273155 RepID=A0A1Z4VNF9_9GAMM|nr:hypothetical protein [Thiohalobacter thiocyanaticus]BAZ93137.1 uncharacterized protein FOKN1_0735 [Thiohalobacter thiocyanaticus]
MKKQITVIACAFAFASGSAMAGEQAGKFKQLDANQDGYISAEEAQASQALSSQWQSVDQDGNNQVDESEFSAFEMEPQQDTNQ